MLRSDQSGERARSKVRDMIKSKMEVMHALWIRGIQEDLLAVSI